MTADYAIPRYVEAWQTSLFGSADMAPWLIVERAEQLILEALGALGPDYRIDNHFAAHRSATIEAGVILKGSGIIGPRCVIASGSYLRGGTYIGQDCTIRPSSELKTVSCFQDQNLLTLTL